MVKPTIVFGSVAFLFLLGVCWFAIQYPATWELSDFNVTFYRAGRLLLQGENIYQNAYPHPFNSRQYPPFAPQWILFVFVPLAILPLSIAQGIRVVLTIVLLIFLLRLTARWAGWRNGRVALGLGLAPWLIMEVHTGQVTPLVFLGVLLCFWGVRRASARMTAVGLWLALAKPHLVLLVVIATVAFAWHKRILGKTVLLLASLIALYSLPNPLWFVDMIEMNLTRLANPRSADSILLLPGYPWAQLIVLGGGAVLFLFAFKYRLREPTVWLWTALLGTSLVSALHTFVYDWELLAPLFALLLTQAWGKWFTGFMYGYAWVWFITVGLLGLQFLPLHIVPAITWGVFLILWQKRQIRLNTFAGKIIL